MYVCADCVGRAAQAVARRQRGGQRRPRAAPAAALRPRARPRRPRAAARPVSA